MAPAPMITGQKCGKRFARNLPLVTQATLFSTHYSYLTVIKGHGATRTIMSCNSLTKNPENQECYHVLSSYITCYHILLSRAIKCYHVLSCAIACLNIKFPRDRTSVSRPKKPKPYHGKKKKRDFKQALNQM